MLHSHIIAGSAVNVYAAPVKAISIQINAALTGTITISDEVGTTGSPVVGIITNPTVGLYFKYIAFRYGVCITPSTTCDITVNLDNNALGQASLV